jgi:hypothetical protein
MSEVARHDLENMYRPAPYLCREQLFRVVHIPKKKLYSQKEENLVMAVNVAAQLL